MFRTWFLGAGVSILDNPLSLSDNHLNSPQITKINCRQTPAGIEEFP